MVQYYRILLVLSISSNILSTYAMQEQITLLDLPEFVVHNILKYCSTRQILLFEQVNKQTQQVAKNLLKADSSKKITIKANAQLPSAQLLQKITGVELQIGNEYIDAHRAHSSNDVIENISHIKALSLKVLQYIDCYAASINTSIAQQLHNLISLTIHYSSVTYCSTNEHYSLSTRDYAVDMLNIIPTYTYLKKLYIKTLTVPFDILMQLLSQFTNLHVLHIEGSYTNKGDFYAFIKALQQLTLLRKLCLHINTIEENEADALSSSLAILTNIQILNLRKAIISPKSINTLKEKCRHIRTICSPQRST